MDRHSSRSNNGNTNSNYGSPLFIALLGVMAIAVVLMVHHCILVTWCKNGGRRRPGAGRTEAQAQQHHDNGSSVEISTVRLMATPVVCVYGKGGGGGGGGWWGETMCPVCLSDFADGEAVRVLPECMHYFHVACIDTWLRAHTSCPMCRAETTPNPSPSTLHHQLSLGEIL